MTYDEAKALLAKVTYKAGWSFELVESLGRGWTLHIAAGPVHDSLDPSQTSTLHYVADFWYGMEAMEREFLAFVKRSIEGLELHELDEWLKVDGAWLNNPHPGDGRPVYGVDPAVEAAERKKLLDQYRQAWPAIAEAEAARIAKWELSFKEAQGRMANELLYGAKGPPQPYLPEGDVYLPASEVLYKPTYEVEQTPTQEVPHDE